jgi:hypothetical protein
MIYITVFIALLLFIYINRSLQKRRVQQREKMHERRQEHIQRFFAVKKKAEGSNNVQGCDAIPYVQDE